MKVNILGTEYEIIVVDEEDNERFQEVDAWCDTSVKKIIIGNRKRTEYDKEDVSQFRNKVLRHEMIHAFIYESGLDVESVWALNETLVDFFAIQIPKMAKLFEEANIL